MGLRKSQGDWDGVRKAVDTRLAPVECLKKLPSPHLKTGGIGDELQWTIDME